MKNVLPIIIYLLMALLTYYFKDKIITFYLSYNDSYNLTINEAKTLFTMGYLVSFISIFCGAIIQWKRDCNIFTICANIVINSIINICLLLFLAYTITVILGGFYLVITGAIVCWNDEPIMLTAIVDDNLEQLLDKYEEINNYKKFINSLQ
jgi:hypothetical protein